MSFTEYQLELLRQEIDWEKWPLDIEDWSVDLNCSTNCLAFALGITCPATFCSIYEPIILKNFITDFCYGVGLDCRELSSIDEASEDEIIIQCYEKNLLNGRFHVIRRNPNGKWVHKEGWYNAPTEITFNGYFGCLYPPESKGSIFAVKKKAS